MPAVAKLASLPWPSAVVLLPVSSTYVLSGIEMKYDVQALSIMLSIIVHTCVMRCDTCGVHGLDD